MLEDLYYRRRNVVDIDAAVVGVSRLRWASLLPAEISELAAARARMARQQFDVLPIDQPGVEVTAYLRTRHWGDYSEVEQHEIQYEDVIPQQTPLHAVIQGFAENGRHHYFLAHEGRITGLVTVVNLNCRQARILLFSLLSDLEVNLGRLVQSRIGNGLSVDDVLSEAKPDVQERYAADQQKSVDADVVEYLYLTDLLKWIGRLDLYTVLGYETKAQFKKAFSRLVELRNATAHPTRSIIRDAEGAGKLWRDIQVIERAMFRLRRWRATNNGA